MAIQSTRVGAVAIQDINLDKRERLLRGLATATFLIFFQAYMVAPLIPRLSGTFGVSSQTIGLVVPAYMIPYGIATLFYGLLSDRLGRRPIMFASLLAFAVLTALTSTAQSALQLIGWRLLTGLGASGVVPLALALMGDLFPYEQRGRPLGWLFGAMAGGAAFGATVGVILGGALGWRMLFVGVGAGAACLLVLLLPYRSLFPSSTMGPSLSFHKVFAAYRDLLAAGRGCRTYGYVLWNGIFHGGVFAWLGLYLAGRYGLGEVGIGLALLGYGIPGFLLGPAIGRAADRWGRRWLVPAGLAIASLAAVILIPTIPLLMAPVAAATLSLGYDMTQPLLAGIITDLGGKRGGQAMGLNVFMLFIGFGVGSFLFGEVLRLGFGVALAIFSTVQLAAALLAIPLFRREVSSRAR
ncbi:MAG: MFS transporter [Candidatus Methylomirabilota bacterium]|nr:MAG: MFS transporter [candidate division NC10 bacterium]